MYSWWLAFWFQLSTLSSNTLARKERWHVIKIRALFMNMNGRFTLRIQEFNHNMLSNMYVDVCHFSKGCNAALCWLWKFLLQRVGEEGQRNCTTLKFFTKLTYLRRKKKGIKYWPVLILFLIHLSSLGHTWCFGPILQDVVLVRSLVGEEMVQPSIVKNLGSYWLPQSRKPTMAGGLDLLTIYHP